MHYVYVLINEQREIYIGYSADLKARVEAHNLGINRSTKGHQWRLVYCEAYLAEQDAREREKGLKISGQAKRWLKERIANSLELSAKS